MFVCARETLSVQGLCVCVCLCGGAALYCFSCAAQEPLAGLPFWPAVGEAPGGFVHYWRDTRLACDAVAVAVAVAVNKSLRGSGCAQQEPHLNLASVFSNGTPPPLA